MSLRFFNTLTRQVEEFVPRDAGKVAMYTCGPTVYNRAHIGNFRTFLFSDMVRRYFRYRGQQVTAVMNITDIDDRTIKGAQQEGVPMSEFTERYTKIFLDDCAKLNIRPADVNPKATEHIPEMVEIVKRLAEKGIAYESEGSWYFRVNAFPAYGEFARLDTEGMRQVERVAADEYRKQDSRDFALWKAWEAEDGEVFWETDLGKGRPGWHLECSAMSLKYLGEDFDIHLGGVDLIFPHHQNEIAQTEAATGQRLARYWMHSEFLMIEADKMSKSLGNFYTLGDVLDQGWQPREIRFALMSTHYRQQLNFTYSLLEQARNALDRLDCCIQNLRHSEGQGGEEAVRELTERHESQFQAALDDDFNYSEALAAVFGFIREVNILCTGGKIGPTEAELVLSAIRRFDDVLGFVDVDRALAGESDEEIEALVCARSEARAARDWAEADRIRKLLAERNIVVEDRSGGSIWRRKQ
ncbi:cysteine--tRNA ligase [bacterium]|nr:cysteine--tRNA ligase [bacterium]MBU1983954.1 cysteine--tRNA ligase [bacterium]